MDRPLLDGWSPHRFQDHPQLHSAACVAATYALDRFNGSWLRNRLLNDRGRFLLALLVLDLHLNESGGRGITVAQIRREATRYEICSNGRAIAFAAALRFANYLALASDADSREKRLLPTKALLDLHHVRWRTVMTAVGLMDGEAARRAEALPDDVFLSRCTGGLSLLLRSGVRIMDSVPALRAFAERDAGIAILLALFLAQTRNETVTVTAAAQSFAVSRAHASYVLQAAERQHLAVFHGPRLGYAATEELKSTVERFYCDVFAMVCYAIDV